VTGANTNDSIVFEALLDDLPKVSTPAGGRRCRPDKCHADKAYDHRRCRGYLTRRGIKARIARRGIEPSDRLGRHRWKAERSIAWLAGCRRLRIRYERDSERFFAFAMLACDRLCYNRLRCTAEAHAGHRNQPVVWKARPLTGVPASNAPQRGGRRPSASAGIVLQVILPLTCWPALSMRCSSRRLLSSRLRNCMPVTLRGARNFPVRSPPFWVPWA
jgi:transposase